jgi:cystathionine beta-lyase family protein involved in aluminum resistance
VIHISSSWPNNTIAGGIFNKTEWVFFETFDRPTPGPYKYSSETIEVIGMVYTGLLSPHVYSSEVRGDVINLI